MAIDTSAHAFLVRTGSHLLGRAVRLGLDSAGVIPVLADLTALASRVALGVALLHGPTAHRITASHAESCSLRR